MPANLSVRTLTDQQLARLDRIAKARNIGTRAGAIAHAIDAYEALAQRAEQSERAHRDLDRAMRSYLDAVNASKRAMDGESEALAELLKHYRRPSRVPGQLLIEE